MVCLNGGQLLGPMHSCSKAQSETKQPSNSDGTGSSSF
jgi:hypothetical protein